MRPDLLLHVLMSAAHEGKRAGASNINHSKGLVKKLAIATCSVWHMNSLDGRKGLSIGKAAESGITLPKQVCWSV